MRPGKKKNTCLEMSQNIRHLSPAGLTIIRSSGLVMTFTFIYQWLRPGSSHLDFSGGSNIKTRSSCREVISKIEFIEDFIGIPIDLGS